MPAPANDLLAGAVELGGYDPAAQAGTTVEATVEAAEAPYLAGETASVWYAWTCPGTAPHEVVFALSGVALGADHRCRVYTGAGYAAPGLVLVTEVATAGAAAASVTLAAPVAGTRYLLQVVPNAAAGAVAGAFTLDVTSVAPPANDRLAQAVEVAGLTGSVAVTTVGAGLEAGEAALGLAGAGRSVWVGWTTPADGVADQVTFSVNTVGAHRLAVLVDSNTTIAGLTLVRQGAADEVAFTPSAGARYVVRVDAASAGTGGPATLSWAAAAPPEVVETGVWVSVEDGTDVPADGPVIDPDLSGIGVLRRISETYPAPVLDASTGRPAGWAPTARVDEEWGRLSFAIDGVSVTKVRGVASRLESMVLQEPFGDGPAQLVIPGASLWDKGRAGFEWLREEANVNISRRTPAGAYRPLWSGIVLALSPSRGGWALQLEGAFAGPAGMLPHRPKLKEAERDWGRAMTYAIRRAGRGASRRKTITEVSFGITTRDRGARSETLLEYVTRGLAQCQLENGDQWTLARAVDGAGVVIRRKYEWRLKDRTTVHLTVRAGQRGVDVSGLRRDLSDVVRQVFGEGVTTEGGRWRGTKLPNIGKETVPPFGGSNLTIGSTGDAVVVWQAEVLSDGWRTGDLEALTNGVFGELEAEAARDIQRAAGLPVTGVVDAATWDATWSNGDPNLNLGGARFDPIAADARVRPFLYTSNGSVKAFNPAWDRSLLPLGRFVSYGTDVTKKQAARSARAELARAAAAAWRGTIVLDGVDPPEMSRLDIREGMNIRVLDFDNAPLLHIAGVRWARSGPSYAVTLDVDEAARDLLTLAQLRARDRAARQDPARAAIAQLRRSTQVRDTPGMWDTEGGFGVLPRRDAAAGWNVYKVAAGKYGTLSRIRVKTTGPATRFAVALFGAKPTRTWLAATVPDPFADLDPAGYGPWDDPATEAELADRWFIEVFGKIGQRGGYSPGFETHPDTGKATGNPVTGVLDVASPTDYVVETEPLLYVAVFVEAACKVRGQLFLLPSE